MHKAFQFYNVENKGPFIATQLNSTRRRAAKYRVDVVPLSVSSIVDVGHVCFVNKAACWYYTILMIISHLIISSVNEAVGVDGMFGYEKSGYINFSSATDRHASLVSKRAAIVYSLLIVDPLRHTCPTQNADKV